VTALLGAKTVIFFHARGEKSRNGTGREWSLEVPFSGGNRPRARKKAPQGDFFAWQDAPRLLRGKGIALSSFLQFEYILNV